MYYTLQQMRWLVTSRWFLLTLGLVFLASTPTFAQNLLPPDLSGTWLLNLAKSKINAAPPGAISGYLVPESLVIKCAALCTEISIWSSRAQYPRILRPGLGGDGVGAGNCYSSAASSHWEHSSLVTESSYTLECGVGGIRTSHSAETWTLSPDGHTLTCELVTDGGPFAGDNIGPELLIYDLKGSTDANSCGDISGRWKLNGLLSRIPYEGAVEASETVYIDCFASTVRMNLTGNTAGQWQTFVTDMNEHATADSEFGQVVRVAWWIGWCLVTESRGAWRPPAGGLYSLEWWTPANDGRRLYRSRQSPYPQVLVYDKQP